MNPTQKVAALFGGARLGGVRRARRVAALATASAIAAVALAGCGGSGSKSPASGGSGSSASAAGTNRLERFSQCMRAHGEPNFPDPDAQGRFQLPAGMSTTSSQFQAAQEACKSLAPPGPLNGQALNQNAVRKALRFVACMRSHGAPTFPDPNAQGKFKGGGSLPVNSPQFFSAFRTCRALLPPGSGFGAGG
jgi:hypothetical protein